MVKNWAAVIFPLVLSLSALGAVPTIQELKSRPFLDDYYSNVVYGHDLVTDTGKYAAKYVGNGLKCANCHLDAGTRKDALPLNIAGIYPQWRSKNSKRNDVSLRIRECFFYSLNGIMPSNDAPELQAIAAYISYLSTGQTIGTAPEGRGMPTLPATGHDPNPFEGRNVYEKKCSVCHGANGQGVDANPPVWGMRSYNKGAGMNQIPKAAGFIWANMPYGNGKTLSVQEAFDVAAFLNQQIRPDDPREGKLLLLLKRFLPPSLINLITAP